MIGVSFDIEALERSMNALVEEAERKMRGMVQKFSYRVMITVTSRTPMGDSDKNAQYYLDRVMRNPYGGLRLQPLEGFARGSWQATPDSDGVINTDIQEYYGKESGDYALMASERSMSAYKLGQTVFLTNTGPYINLLEKNYSDQTMGQGIMQPTLDQVTGAIQAELDDFYHKS